MEALVLRVVTRHGQTVEHRKFETDSVAIGRGFRNDLILPDAHIAAEQFRIRRDGEQLWLDVLDATNPMRLNGKACAGASCELKAGDVIALGHTEIALYLEDSAVPAVRRLAESWWSRLGRWRAVVASVALLLTCASALYADYLETVNRIDWGELLPGSIFLGFVVLLWSSLWAMAGRLLRSQAQFSSHLLVSAGLTWITMLVSFGASYASYASDLPRVVAVVEFLSGALLSMLLVYFNLRFATNLRRPAVAAIVATSCVFALAYGLGELGKEDFNPQPGEETLLKPPFAQLRYGKGFDAFEENLDTLFAELRKDQKTEKEAPRKSG